MTEITGGDKGAGGIAQRHQPHHAHRAQIARPNVETEEHHDAEQADQQPDHTSSVEPIGMSGQAGEDQRRSAARWRSAARTASSEVAARRLESSHHGTAISTTQ